MHALGIGHPANVAACVPLGYATFDSALPTRDARRGRLYVMAGPPTPADARWFRFLYVTDDKYIKAAEPVDPTCDCLTCTHYSRGYLRHLYRANEAAFQRLATLHNLRFMSRLMAGAAPSPAGGAWVARRSETPDADPANQPRSLRRYVPVRNIATLRRHSSKRLPPVSSPQVPAPKTQ